MMSEGYQVNILNISILVEPLTICRGNDLKELVSLGREGTTVILDEVSEMIFGLLIPFSLTYSGKLVLFVVHIPRAWPRLREFHFFCKIC